MTTRGPAPSTDWRESFWGGSEQAEDQQFAVWAQEIQDIQYNLRAKNNAPALRRGFHAKQHVRADNATFTLPNQLPRPTPLRRSLTGAPSPPPAPRLAAFVTSAEFRGPYGRVGPSPCLGCQS